MAITSEEAIASLQKRGLTPTQARIKAEFERLSGNQTNAISPTQPPLVGINSLEDIQKKIQAISGQIPTIQAGIQTLQGQPKPVVQLQPQATEPTEGSTRVNPQTGQKERFSPAGVWETMPTAEQIGQFAPPPGTEGVTGAGTGAQPLTQPQAPTSDVVKSPLDALSLQSGASLSSLDLDGFAKIIRDAYQPVADAQKAYLDELKATPSLVKQFEELLTAQGIPQLRKEFSTATKRALEVEAQLERLPDDVKQRVQDYLITQKQFERVTATEAKPLTALYNAITRSRAQTGAELESRMAEIGTYISLIDKDTQRKMNALQFGIQTSQGQFDITSKVAEMGLGEQQRQLQTEKIQAEIAKLKQPETQTDKSLSILDIQRYQELYPNSGIVAGDTETQANAKVAASNTPEAKTRALIVAAKDNGNDYKTVVKEINSDSTIKDKETALKIAKEVFGIEEKAVAPISAIEQEITQMKKGGILTDADIRFALKSRYSEKEITDSSVGGLLNKAGSKAESFINSIGNFLFGKF